MLSLYLKMSIKIVNSIATTNDVPIGAYSCSACAQFREFEGSLFLTKKYVNFSRKFSIYVKITNFSQYTHFFSNGLLIFFNKNDIVFT